MTSDCSPVSTPWSSSPPTATGSPCSPAAAWPPRVPGRRPRRRDRLGQGLHHPQVRHGPARRGGAAAGGRRGRRPAAGPRRPPGGDQPAPRLGPDRRGPAGRPRLRRLVPPRAWPVFLHGGPGSRSSSADASGSCASSSASPRRRRVGLQGLVETVAGWSSTSTTGSPAPSPPPSSTPWSPSRRRHPPPPPAPRRQPPPRPPRRSRDRLRPGRRRRRSLPDRDPGQLTLLAAPACLGWPRQPVQA